MLRSHIIGGSLAAALMFAVSSVTLAAGPVAPAPDLASPATASTQGDDAAYCLQLSALYRRYLGSGTVQGQNIPDTSAAVAMDGCQTRNAAAGIQLLEQKLRDSQVTLPKRG